MAGYLRPKGPDRWELQVSGGTDPGTGQRVRKSRTFTGSKRAAEKALAVFVAEVDNGQLRTGEATVAHLITTWLDLAGEQLSPTTLHRYRIIARVHILPALGTVRLGKLDVPRIERFYRDLSETLAPRTVRQVHAVLRRALAHGQRWGWCDRNAAALATKPAVHRADVHAPPADTVQRLVTACLDAHPAREDLADIILLAALTGGRRGELVGLQWADLDEPRGELWIRRAIIDPAGNVTEKTTKTYASRRLALDPVALGVLRDRRARVLERAMAAHGTLGPWIFGHPEDPLHREPWPPADVTRRFRNLVKVHAPGVRFHDLRHLAATLMLDAGIPVPTVSKRLGHRDAATTLGIYGHAVEASDRRAADILGDAIGRKG